MINNYILLQKKLIERNALKIMYKMKCISKDRSGEPCNFRKVGETLFCKFHQHMVDYTPEMLEQVKSCSTCRKMYYLGEYSTCDGCRDRGGKNRETNKQTVVKCSKDTCKYKKSVENKYCKLHQIELFLEETKEMGLKNCVNYVRGCREKLDTEYKFSRCQSCLKKDRENDHKKRGSVAEAPKVEGMKSCSVCCKSHPESEYIGLKGETKTCRECRDGFKRADDKRYNEHVKELARENAQKPERQEVKKEWRENNKEKTIDYWIKYYCTYIRKNITSDFIETNIKIAEEKHDLNYFYYIYSALRNKIEFEIDYETYLGLVDNHCSYCGIKRENGKFVGIDKVDPKRGYVRGNCVSCCKLCNFMKSNIDVTRFLNIVEHIACYNNPSYAQKLHPESFPDSNPLNITLSKYNDGAFKRDYAFELTQQQFDEIIHQNCYICGKKSVDGNMNGIDRFDNNKGYIFGNVRCCCKTCNKLKLNFTYEDIMDKINKIYMYKIKKEISETIDDKDYDEFTDENNFVTEKISEELENEVCGEISIEIPKDVEFPENNIVCELSNEVKELDHVQQSINTEKKVDKVKKISTPLFNIVKPSQQLTDEEKIERIKEMNRLKKQRQRERQKESLGEEAYLKMNADKMKEHRNK